MGQNAYITPLTAVETTDKEGIGKIRWEGNKCYKWVKFLNTTATVAGASGDFVIYTSEDGYEDHEVCADYSDGDTKPNGAGTLQATVTGTLTVSYYCWIQIKGLETLNIAIETSNDGTPVACADGDPLTIGDADKTMRRQNTVIDADTERLPDLAITQDASAKTVILDCPF